AFHTDGAAEDVAEDEKEHGALDRPDDDELRGANELVDGASGNGERGGDGRSHAGLLRDQAASVVSRVLPVKARNTSSRVGRRRAMSSTATLCSSRVLIATASL